MGKHLRGLKLLKWQIYWEQQEQYVTEETKEKGDRKHSLAFSILRFKTKQKKFRTNWKVANLMPLFHRAWGHTRKLQAS